MSDDKTFAKTVNTYSKKRYSLPGDVFKALRSPLVYVIFGGKHVLYVGSSTGGCGRPFEKYHQAISIIKEPIEDVHLYVLDHPGDIALLEQYLIREFRPAYNKAHMPKSVDNPVHWSSYQPHPHNTQGQAIDITHS